MYKDTIERNNNALLLKISLFSGAPYEESLSDGIISLQEDIQMSINPFRYIKDEDFNPTDKEMFELLDKIG